tara:strand:+ start:120 stop:443 length:324 start_codon:yes stop_codon:yes gene_type:complete
LVYIKKIKWIIKIKKKNRKQITFRTANKRNNKRFYNIDHTPIEVTLKDFEIYTRGLKKSIYTPFPHDSKKASLYTNLTLDQIMYIKVNFIILAKKYNYNMHLQKLTL